MAARSVFSLRTSVFNDFLYAPIGEEQNGMVLTALSALARLGVDPWDEAARLSALPEDTATKRLTAMIAGLPRGRWAEASVKDIAARLAALLPAKPPPAAQHAKPAMSSATRAMIVFLFIFFANAVAFTALRTFEHWPSQGQSAAADSQSTAARSTPAPPHAPSP
jgi:hypothetical protein